MFNDNAFLKRFIFFLIVFSLSIMLFVLKLDQKQKDASIMLGRFNPASALYRPSHEDMPSPPPLPPSPEILAQSYLVHVIGDNDALIAHEEKKQMYPASLTKILTSVLAMEELNKDAPIIFSIFAKQAGEKESIVPPGETFVRNDAIRFAMIESANDAAVALGEAIGRKRGAFSFTDAMTLFKQAANQKAKELEMFNSQFENPTGLDNENHYTTAEDLFKLVRYAWRSHLEIWDFSRISETNISSLGGTLYHSSATNQLLSEFPALIGGKTGLTDAAKGTLILLYPITSDRIAVVIILGSDDRFEDGRKLIHWLENAFNPVTS